MTEDKEAENQPSPKSKSTNPKSKPTKPNRSLHFGIGLVAILAIIAIGLSLWTQQTVRKQQNTATQLNDLQQTQTTSGQQLSQLEQTLQQTQNTLNTQQQSLTTTGNQLQSLQTNVRNLQRAQGQSSEQWKLNEIDYLLRLSQLKLMFAQDINGAIDLLQTADNDLQQLNDPRLNSVRQAIIQDLTQLHAIPNIDISGIFHTLNSLSDQILQLPLAATMMPRDDNQNQTSIQTPPPGNDELTYWQRIVAELNQGWEQSVAKLGQVIQIRRNDTPITPILSAAAQSTLQQSIQLNLQSAALALLQHDQQIYVTALNNVQNQIQHYYQTSNPTTQQIVAQLQQLAAINIQPQLPNINQSITALQQVFDESDAPTSPQSPQQPQDSQGG